MHLYCVLNGTLLCVWKAPILPTSSESENDDEELPIISISTSMGPSTSHENPVDIEGPIAIESLMDIEVSLFYCS